MIEIKKESVLSFYINVDATLYVTPNSEFYDACYEAWLKAEPVSLKEFGMPFQFKIIQVTNSSYKDGLVSVFELKAISGKES